MPFIVTETAGAAAESQPSLSTIEMVPRGCALEEYKKIKKVPTFDVTGDLIAYASPDSTYAVTRRLLDSAKKEIVIGIYDFTADYMKALLLSAMQRGVKVSLMLDIDSKKEEEVFKDLAKFGCKTVPAPSCASKNVSYFPSSHEITLPTASPLTKRTAATRRTLLKVIVIWVLPFAQSRWLNSLPKCCVAI
jgi:hypothetical protein